jgi:hypothetical protein
MVENKLVDSSKMLSNQDYKDLNAIKNIKKRIMDAMDKKIFIESIIDIVDSCDFIDFRNERSRKYINGDKPVLNLTIKLENEDKYDSLEKEIKYKSKLVHDNITFKIIRLITDSINTNDKISEYVYSTELFKITDEEEKKNLSNFGIFSTMFGLRFDRNNPNNVVVEMIF